MKKHLRRYAMGAMAVGAMAGGTAFALQGAEPDWHPVTYGLTATPADLLPANVSTAQPVRVVSTALDRAGRPIVTVHTATDTTAATALVKQAQKAPNAVGVEVDAPMHALDLATGTDTYRGQQWDLTKIRTADAWQKATGAGVVVAVLDTGVDASHPDLAGQVLAGFDEIAQKAGVTTDPAGHGTHVAGTIAALTGNGVGVGSVAPNAKIMPIRVLDGNGSGYMSDAANGIVYAADHGANVINMSLGTSSKVAAVSNAIAYARGKGVVVVASSGNDRAKGSPVNYPAADEGVIGVAATDSNDAVASYSTAGGYVDVAAPGTAVFNTYPTAKGGYATMSGTSMASPHAAAVAALLKSYNPALTPDQIEQAMESSAVDLGAKGRDNDFGYGRIDAAAALAAVKPATTAPATTAPATTAPATTAPATTAPAAPATTKPAATEPTKPATTAPTAPATTKPATTEPAKTPVTTSPAPAKTPTAAPTPVPTTTPVKVRPAVTVGAPVQTVTYGTTAATTFTVTAGGLPWALRPVSVCVTEAGGKPVCTAATTSAAGVVTVQRVATAGFQVQLTVAATDVSEAVTSPVAATQVAVKLTVTRSGGTATVGLVGAVGQTTQFQVLKSSGWTTVLTFRAVERGTVSGLVTGQSYRVAVPDTASVLGATSDKF